MTKFIDLNNLPTGTYESDDSLCSSAKFQEGERFALEWELTDLGLTSDNAWYARTANGSSISSYERVGYHRGSVAYFRGMMHAMNTPAVMHHDDGTTSLIRGVYSDEVNRAWANVG